MTSFQSKRAAAQDKLAQPAQKPVAWSDEHLQFLNFLYGAGEFDGVWFDQKHPKEKGEFWWRKHLRRLFDAPPQRPWVDLTDDEIDVEANKILTSDPVQWWRRLARAVLAKSKELNT